MNNWNLDYFYKSPTEWEKDLVLVEEMIAKLPAFAGKLGDLATFKSYYETTELVLQKLFKVFAYANRDSDLNLKNSTKGERAQKAMFAYIKLQQATAFDAPETIALGKEKIMEFVNQDDFLKQYRFPLEKLFLQQEHVLSNTEEAILANFGPVRGVANDLHQAMSIIDAKDVSVTLSDNTTVTVTLSNYRSLIPAAKTKEDRQLIFEAAYQRFADNPTSFANTYNLVLQNLAANYRSRSYASALDSALFGNNIPISVFHSLKDAAWVNTAPLKRYIELRKKILKISDYKTYDRFINLVKSDTKYSYEDAKKLFLDSIKHLDKEFVKYQNEALAEGFIDVNPSDGKRTGAYSSSFHGQHPFILLNHDETLDSVFTLAHEAGHSAHSMLAEKSEPMATSSYTIFVAEIASTFNEHVLLDHLLANAKTKNEKIALLEHAVNGISATFYRQTLFAHYEFEANELVAKGIPVTVDSLSAIMIKLYQQYYDLDITKEPGKKLIWAYIPHLFGSPFYVYQYATAYSASLKIYENVKNNVPGTMTKYLDMLKSGGNDFPVNLVKKAGVDLTKVESFQAVINRFEDLLSQLEKLI